ncbi:MAG TPA: phytoene/squalene synthase family protein [Lichenihabitans sp.]|jgi:phytoene synthase|nr:phytoene/squalene synthase family protein [Lichenihabitans sp.]
MTHASDPYGFCETVVRDGDRDAWLASLFAPASARPSLHALDAFRIEIGHVRGRVSQPLAGEIRLQWWRDAILGKARGEASANPLAAALIDTIRRHDLPRDLFDVAIDAHRGELHEPAPGSVAGLEARLDAMTGTFIRLASIVLASPAGDVPAAAGHAGIALGLCRTLQGFAEDAPRGWSAVPVEVLDRHGVGQGDVAAGVPTSAIKAALADMRALARRHLGEFSEARRTIPKAAAPAYLRLASIEPDLRRLDRQQDRDPFAPPHPLPQWRRQWILWRAAGAGG